MNNSETTPIWRIILSVLFAIFMVGKLAYRCSHMNQKNTNADANNIEVQNAIGEMQNHVQETMDYTSKNNFYKTYRQLDELEETKREIYGIRKLEKDSSIFLDLQTKITIPEKSFFMNNHDDSLRFVSKFPNNETFWVHDFSSSDHLKTILKSIKGNGIHKIDEVNSQSKKMKILQYELVKNNLKYNGFAIGFQENGTTTFLEFESNTKTKSELQTDALTYIMKFLK